MPLKMKELFFFTQKSQIKILEPSRKSQARARERVKTEFKAYINDNSLKTGVVIVRRSEE